MNIFYLDTDLKLCAEYHVDKHVVKMPTEAMQIVSTALRDICSANQLREIYPSLYELPLYKPTHFHHPLVKWAAGSLDRVAYILDYGIAVAYEYKYRYGREIMTMARLKITRDFIARLGGRSSSQDIPLCMPPEYRTTSAIESYRKYYAYAKAHLHSWTNRPTPNFIIECSRAASVGG